MRHPAHPESSYRPAGTRRPVSTDALAPPWPGTSRRHRRQRHARASNEQRVRDRIPCRTPGRGTYARGEPVEQLSVERLVLELPEDAPDVLVGYEVVAGLVVLTL